ncbi:MAG: prolipoprotein diacylglyceryl transferase [Candidatus Omnitrophica bacterium]|nr:prolipoprotein diacylglyceryl transferase [Candidatus Omnitrophota bacterium]
MHPILFRWGPFTFYSYGLMLALGFLGAIRLAARRALRLGLNPTQIQTLGVVVLLGGIAGARAAYVALNWAAFRSNLLEIIRLDHGGLVFYGGLAGGILTGIWTVRKAQLPLWITVDLMVPPLVLAHAIGRIGCFLNGCCYGKPSSVPWAVVFPPETVPRHPTQLYESGALILLFFLLKAVERRRPRPGTVFLIYGFSYGIWRFFIEFLRGDNPAAACGLTAFQWASIPLALTCGWLLFKSFRGRQAEKSRSKNRDFSSLRSSK